MSIAMRVMRDRVNSSPMAITPEAARSLVYELSRNVDMWDESLPEEPQAASASAAQGEIAVLPVYGIIYPEKLDALGRVFDKLVADAGVSAIVMLYDTPGGSVYGVDEFATKIFNARNSKKVVSQISPEAASAGYYLASQGTEIVITPSGQAGSIGVVTMHVDWSKSLEQAGYKVTVVTAGRYKWEGHPFEPLGEEARANLQESVDAYYGMFTTAVARGRGVKQNAVKAGFGQGRMVIAQQAVDIGLADRIGTLDETLTRMRGRGGASRNRAELARRRLDRIEAD